MATPFKTLIRRSLACAMVCAGAAQAAGAQTPSPAPAPAAGGFTARAHADLTVLTQGRTITGSAQIGMAQRPNLTRIDVFSVKSDAMPLPPISVSCVIDRHANTITVWSDLTKRYHVQGFLPKPAASATPQPSPGPGASTPPRLSSPLSKLDIFSMTLKLTGHTVTNGVPTTGLAFDLQVAKKGETVPNHLTATVQIVDDSAAFPMTITASVEPSTAAALRANLAYAVDELSRTMPPLAHFVVPAGYVETGSLKDVVMPAH